MSKFGKWYEKIPVAAKASVWFAISSILQKGIAFLTTPIFCRLLSTEQYGQVTIYNSWVEVFTIFATLNLFYGVYNNALTKYSEDRDVVSSSMLGLCSSITIIVFSLYLVFRDKINQLTGMPTLMTCVLFGEVFFIPAFRFWAAYQRFEYKYKKLVIASLIISILTPTLGIPIVILSIEKGYAKILTGVFSQVVVAIVLYFVLFSKGKTFFSRKYWKYAIAFNLPLIPHYLSSVILNQSDRIMIDHMCGTDKAGIYGLSYTIGSIALIINEAIMNSFTPWTYQKLKIKDYESVKKIASSLILIIAFMALGLVMIAPEILFLCGKDYYEGMWIIGPIAASVFFRFVYLLYANIEFFYEKNYFIMCASVCCALLNIFLNYICINKYGYLAASFTTLACYCLYSIAHFFFSKIVFKKATGNKSLYNDSFVFVIGILVIFLSIGIMLLYNSWIVRYLLILIILCIIVLFRKKIYLLIKMIRSK